MKDGHPNFGKPVNHKDVHFRRQRKRMLPSKQDKPNGLHEKYRVLKADGGPAPGEYFVLRLDKGGKDPAQTAACRKAVLTYADAIEPHLPQLAADLRSRYAPQPKQVTPGEGTGRFIYRDYWNSKQSERPYQGVIHGNDDEPIDIQTALEAMLADAGMQDGDEFELVVRRTGKRPYSDRIWKKTAPHIYEPVEN